MQKLPIFDKNHGLTPWKKIPIFQVFKVDVFYSLEKRFLYQEYRKTFSWFLLP